MSYPAYIYKPFKSFSLSLNNYVGWPPEYIAQRLDAVKWLIDNKIEIQGMQAYTDHSINPYSKFIAKFTAEADLLAFTLLFREVLE